MNTLQWISALAYTILLIALGSYGAYVLFNEFVEMDHKASIPELLVIARRRWYAVLALAAALGLFLHHIITALGT